MGFIDYLEEKLGFDYRDNGAEYSFHCPFCYKNHDYKLYVKAEPEGDKPAGLWDCKRCGRAGNPVGFVMKYENVDFREAKEILELYGIDENQFYNQARKEGLSREEALYLMLMNPKKKEEVKEVKKVPPQLPRGFKLIMDNLDKKEVIPFLNYLINTRGIEASMIPLHNIGYITNGEAKTKSGGVITLRNQLVFLTYDFDGNYTYWNTRSIDPNPYLKSINASGSETEYSKSDVLFNLNTAVKTPQIVLTEGVFDALTVGTSGVAGFGKKYSDKQIELILDNVKENQEIYILLDRDAIKDTNIDGETAADKLADKLYRHHKETYIVVPETDEDPNDLGQEGVWDLISNKSITANPEGRIFASMV